MSGSRTIVPAGNPSRAATAGSSRSRITIRTQVARRAAITTPTAARAEAVGRVKDTAAMAATDAPPTGTAATAAGTAAAPTAMAATATGTATPTATAITAAGVAPMGTAATPTATATTAA